MERWESNVCDGAKGRSQEGHWERLLGQAGAHGGVCSPTASSTSRQRIKHENSSPHSV